MPSLAQVISTNMSNSSDTDNYQYGLTLLSGIPLVEAYREIKPDLQSASVIIQEYGTVTADAAKGGEAVRKRRDELRPQVIDIIQKWSAFATEATPGDVVSWAKAHFKLTKSETTPRPALAVPSKFVVADGPSKGSVKLSQNPQKSTKAYGYEYALAPAPGEAPVWHYCLSNKVGCIISGLDSGQQYLFRCYAWNGTGETAYSAIETRYVQ